MSPGTHMEQIAELALVIRGEDGWPFDLEPPATLIHTTPTPSLTGNSWAMRRDIAEGAIRESLQVTVPEWTNEKDILILEDIFTDGLNLRKVARALINNGGANSVSQNSFARSVFSGGVSSAFSAI